MYVHISPAKPHEVPALAVLATETFHKTYAEFNTEEDMALYTNTYFTPEALAADMALPGVHYFLLHADNDLAGYIKLNEADTTYIPAKAGLEVSRLYVDHRFQGAGYGRMLMEQAESFARTLGKQAIWLGVWKKNTRAVAIYTTLGFEIAGETIFRLGNDPQEDHVMVKWL